MLKFTKYQVVFREIPDEITLAFDISNCPFHCEECHSPELQQDIGEELTYNKLKELILKNKHISNILFLGGDGDLDDLNNMFKYIKANFKLKISWYSGRDSLPNNNIIDFRNLNYIKLGHYDKNLGGLDSPKTNQILYRIDHEGYNSCIFIDITSKFRIK